MLSHSNFICLKTVNKDIESHDEEIKCHYISPYQVLFCSLLLGLGWKHLSIEELHKCLHTTCGPLGPWWSRVLNAHIGHREENAFQQWCLRRILHITTAEILRDTGQAWSWRWSKLEDQMFIYFGMVQWQAGPSRNRKRAVEWPRHKWTQIVDAGLHQLTWTQTGDEPKN